VELLQEVKVVVVVARAVVRQLKVYPHVVAEPLPVAEAQPHRTVRLIGRYVKVVMRATLKSAHGCSVLYATTRGCA
jgi:hypothetical protein